MIRVQERLDQLGMSQYRLARKVGLPHSYINKIARGAIVPRAFRAVLISEALGCTVNDLYVLDR